MTMYGMTNMVQGIVCKTDGAGITSPLTITINQNGGNPKIET